MSELYDQVRENEDVGKILGELTPHGQPKEDMPIQAADFICYLVRTFYEKEHATPGSAHPRTRQLMDELLGTDLNERTRFLEHDFLTSIT